MATFSQTVTVGTNDAKFGTGAPTWQDGTQLQLGQYFGNLSHLIARFVSVSIPKGSTITSALLSVWVGATANTPVLMVGKVGDEANAAMPTTYALANAAAKTAGTAHSKTWTANSGYNTVEIANEVQALVNRSDWASGNAMVVYLMDNGSASGKSFLIDMYDGNAAHAPKIDITYTVPNNSQSGHAFSAGGGRYPGNRRAFHAGGLDLGGF